jgi:hypothetical protein
VFLDIYHLFISQILVDSNIKFFVKNLPIMLGDKLFFGAKNVQKKTSFFLKGIFCYYYFFPKNICKEITNELKKKI